MAGSYKHATTEAGNLRSNEGFVKMVENLGDAYETVEEMYGMIWHIASQFGNPKDVVERARVNYQEGLLAAKAIHARKANGNGSSNGQT